MPASPESHLRLITAICRRLPEAEAVPMTSGRSLLQVRGRRFGYFLSNRHGYNRVSLNRKVPPGAQQAMVASDPALFFVPDYIGRHGWIGVDLNTRGGSAELVAELLSDAYRLAAPKSFLSG